MARNTTMDVETDRDTRIRRWLQTHRWLRLHVGLIALCCLACLGLGGALLRMAGVQALPLRFGLSLLISYAVYLGLLRLWAAYLTRHEDLSLSEGVELGWDVLEAGARVGSRAPRAVETAADLDEGAVVLLPLVAAAVVATALAALLVAGVGLLFGAEAVLAGVALGAALDHWVPQAESLAHALRLWRAH
jgi:hypothetical protein